MERIFMSAGIISAIILCVIGIVKMPFGNFKNKYPKIYKAVFTSASLVMSVGLAMLNQKFILHSSFLSFDFAILIVAVISGVSGTYLSYEGLGLKMLVNKLITAIKALRDTATDRKVVKFLNKIDDVDKALEILINRKNNGEV